MMNARSLRIVVSLFGLLSAFNPLWADESDKLDRGHRLLMKWGLQIQAQVFHSPTDSLDLDRWNQSNFTAVNFQYGQYASAPPYQDNPAYIELLGPAPGIPWGRWAATTDRVDLNAHELPYLPNLVSIQCLDEKDIRGRKLQESMATVFEQWHARSPHTITFHNSFGGAFYPNELQQFMMTVKPDILCFDSYPFRLSHIRKPPGHPIGGSPRTWYEHMQKYRLAALAGHDGTGAQPIPYAQYLDTFLLSHEEPPHLTAESEIRLNQFASWTFGFTFVSAFVYNSPDGHGVEAALFEALGDERPTPAFYHIAETNRQSRNLGPSLVRLQSTDIRIIPGRHMEGSPAAPADNVAPAGLGAVPLWDPRADPYITSITAANMGPMNDGLRGDVLVGYFRPLLQSDDAPDSGNESYFMITNGLTSPSGPAAAAQQHIRITFDFGKSDVSSLQRRDRLTGLVEVVPLVHDDESRRHLDLVLDGGTGDLFKFNTGAAFVE